MRPVAWLLGMCGPVWLGCSSDQVCHAGDPCYAVGTGGASSAGATSLPAAGAPSAAGEGGAASLGGMPGASGEAAEAGASDGVAGANESGGAGGECDASPVSVGALESDALSEVSGIAASARNPGVYYVHNDSGDTARFFAIDERGRTLAEVVLAGAAAVDWEDIALGPGPSAGSFIYLGDVGDNGARVGATPRPSIDVYRVAEPLILLDEEPVLVELTDWARLPLSYPAEAHDCEALLLDPSDSQLLLVTKDNDGQSSVLRASALVPAGAAQTLELVTGLEFSTTQAPGSSLVTGGAVSASGDAILLRTYTSIFFWPRALGQSVASALAAVPQQLPAPDEEQGEAITFSADGRGYLTTSENEHADIFRAPFCDL